MDLTTELHGILKVFTKHLQSQSMSMRQLVLRGILQLSRRQDTARPMIIFLPCIMEQLQDADSTSRAIALPILSTLLQLLDVAKTSFMALELTSKLPALFNDESTTVRQLSMDLFLETLNFVEDRERRKMQKEVHRNLVLLYLHLHDEEESVAKASQKALLGAARFLRWRRLEHLVQTAQFWQIGECLVRTFPHPRTGSRPPCADPALFPLQLAKRRMKAAAQDYVGQSLLYLQSPQEPLRREAVRFIGLLGQHMTDQQQVDRERIYEGLQGLQQDSSPSVSSLALQTLKILQERRPHPPRGHLGQLFSRLRSAWRRWRSPRADS
ncbi:maestro heat-like repeat-containing protein family member 6 [Lagopus muta]|uniref:maestro heat-like repeat-containing protein family member 6 n=1 Tax=Lagopus muta TaxID=64668 RepID=UPI00209D017D|nr:maestro heat-like repeat-containing protein family member 6 [Lagopus muta]